MKGTTTQEMPKQSRLRKIKIPQVVQRQSDIRLEPLILGIELAIAHPKHFNMTHYCNELAGTQAPEVYKKRVADFIEKGEAGPADRPVTFCLATWTNYFIPEPKNPRPAEYPWEVVYYIFPSDFCNVQMQLNDVFMQPGQFNDETSIDEVDKFLYCMIDECIDDYNTALSNSST